MGGEKGVEKLGKDFYLALLLMSKLRLIIISEWSFELTLSD